MPHYILECMEYSGCPGTTFLLWPDDDPSVLAAGCQSLSSGSQTGSPGRISHPVRVSLQLGLLDPTSVISLPPDLHETVAATADEPLDAGPKSRGPAHRVTTDCVGVIDLLCLPLVVGTIGKDRDGPVTWSTGQDQAEVMRCPLDAVNAAVMVCVFMYLRLQRLSYNYTITPDKIPEDTILSDKGPVL